MLRARRRTVITAVAVAGALLAGALVVTLTQGSLNTNGITYLDGNRALPMYTVGHRPRAPRFTATSLTGTPIRLADYLGKVVALNFWGSWCPPCRKESPMLAMLSERYHSQGVSFIGDDVGDTPPKALAFIHSIGISYPSVNDSSYAIVQNFDRVVDVGYTPTTVVIDKTGHISGLIIGKVTYQVMASMLKAARAG